MPSSIFTLCLSAAALSLVLACAGSEPALELNLDAEWQQALKSIPPEMHNDPQLAAVPSPAVRSMIFHRVSSDEEEEDEEVQKLVLLENASGLAVTDMRSSYYSLTKDVGPGGSDVVWHLSYARTKLTAYGGVIDLMEFYTGEVEGTRRDGISFLRNIKSISGSLFPLKVGNTMHVSAERVQKGASAWAGPVADLTQTKITPISSTLRVTDVFPASKINPNLTGRAWRITEDVGGQCCLGSSSVYLEDLAIAHPTGKLVGFDDGQRRIGPSYASIARGHAEAGRDSRERQAAAMTGALMQLGQASAGLAATLAAPDRAVSAPSLPRYPGPSADSFNLNEQIFQQRCVGEGPTNAQDAAACERLAGSLGRTYAAAPSASKANLQGGGPSSSSSASAAAASSAHQGNFLIRQFEDDYFKYNRQVALCDGNARSGTADPARCDKLRLENAAYLQQQYGRLRQMVPGYRVSSYEELARQRGEQPYPIAQAKNGSRSQTGAPEPGPSLARPPRSAAPSSGPNRQGYDAVINDCLSFQRSIQTQTTSDTRYRVDVTNSCGFAVKYDFKWDHEDFHQHTIGAANRSAHNICLRSEGCGGGFEYQVYRDPAW